MTEAPSSAPRSFWAKPNGAPSRREKIAKATGRQAVYILFVLELLSCILLQKFAIPLTLSFRGGTVNLGEIEVALPITYCALAVLFAFRPPKIDLNRLLLLVTFIVLAVLSTVQVNATYSGGSIALAIALSIPLIFEIEISEYSHRRMLKFYINFMTAVGFVVIAQLLMELLFGWRSWPNFDRIFPDNFLYHGFVYIQPLKAGSNLMKPNAFVFLETPQVSQFTALALAIELIYFRRMLRMMFFAIILIATFAGTGILLLALSAPVLLTRMSWKSILGVLAIIGVCIVISFQLNWYQQVNHRFTEYQQTGSSANHRFIEPLDKLGEILQRKNSFFIGEGPGNISKGRAHVWWAVTKVADEYGILTSLSYLALFGYVLFVRAPSQRFGFVLFILLNFMAGFGIPIYQILIFLLGGLFRIRSNDNDESAPKPSALGWRLSKPVALSQ